MNDNILRVAFGSSRMITSNALWQYDYGQVLQIKGITLPELYEVHFSVSDSGDALTAIGNSDGVAIPDELLETGDSIYAHIYLHTGAEDGETEYRIVIPVLKRAKPTHEEPTPVQQTEIEQLIASLNSATDKAEGYAEDAKESAQQSASQSASSAQSASQSASSAQSASQSASSASQSASTASSAASSASQSALSAKDSQDAARQSELNAKESELNAEQAANKAGFMFMDINEHGHLIYRRTDQVDADFHIERPVGHLILEAL